jgi:outer membrane protein OmpA-like peptidoglycan-associated protein
VTNDPNRSEPRAQQVRRRHALWLLFVPALLAIGGIGVLVALGTEPQHEMSRRLVGTSQEPGWWTRVTVERAEPAAPTTPPVVVATIPSDVLFAEGSAELGDLAHAGLSELGESLQASVGPISVEGHTDQRGDEASNMQLGQSRAEAVARLLVDLGVPDDRLVIASFGESRPVCDQINPDGSDNPDCRARCRRVVVTFTTSIEG